MDVTVSALIVIVCIATLGGKEFDGENEKKKIGVATEWA